MTCSYALITFTIIEFKKHESSGHVLYVFIGTVLVFPDDAGTLPSILPNYSTKNHGPRGPSNVEQDRFLALIL